MVSGPHPRKEGTWAEVMTVAGEGMASLGDTVGAKHHD